ncbi:Myb-like DNA-binding domain containing protein [Trichomonas vaginalis G3]|uniref:Myb-like DNA-binding domain containing protein n=1 Tax=Trichomonas vaginalis (strain ATCC PRA-98 / G3) TaxID=412133 RepID=A2E4P9_TRIV3|nr:RNA polymerase II transcription regulator recruiting protein [Trichomonas vaginalis G3]EAY12359.1 Myb-like DNA-binding domain containing protein [Trichomonas vaginalis G3]KAI5500777.1 RNA polymerase II transcription regulator recruiting protein [Trichomonas vaginalis G3]|eukprot:XP_001324582.1 Myb-like DNA-binding domain containing protein [Trichomonas vaginalis G3]
MTDEASHNGVKRRRLFGPEDDKQLETIRKEQTFTGWKNVAKQMPSFTPKQLRDRWHNYLSPQNSFGPWTLEEDKIIAQNVQKYGTKWSQISSCLKGRSDNSVKNRWNSVVKEDYFQNPTKYNVESPHLNLDDNEFENSKAISADSEKIPLNSPTVQNVFLDDRFIKHFFEPINADVDNNSNANGDELFFKI